MNIFQNILSDLIEKKLWPIAVGLIVMLVVVPMTLARPGEPTATATVPPPKVDEDLGPSLSLTRASTTGFARAPRVNDKRLDPFGARYNKAFEAALRKYLADSNSVIDGTSGSSVDTSTTTTGGGDGGGVTPVVTEDPDTGGTKDPKPTATPKPETEQDDLLTVLLSSDAEGASEPTEITDIRTLSPLPDTENPFLVYVGKTSDGKVTFLVSADVTVTGDGACAPSANDCRTLTMKVGDTADFVLLNKNNAKVSVTVTDLETKQVVVSGDEATQEAAQLEAETRAVGAKALKSVLSDDIVLESLVKRGIKIRH